MQKNKGNKGFMAIKVDLEKANDRLDWDFLLDTLKKLGFNDLFINLIFKFVFTYSIQVV